VQEVLEVLDRFFEHFREEWLRLSSSLGEEYTSARDLRTVRAGGLRRDRRQGPFSTSMSLCSVGNSSAAVKPGLPEVGRHFSSGTRPDIWLQHRSNEIRWPIEHCL